MSEAWEHALRAVLASALPREGFTDELFRALQDASVAPLGVVTSEAPGGHGHWILAGTVAGAFGAAGVAIFGLRRHRLRSPEGGRKPRGRRPARGRAA